MLEKNQECEMLIEDMGNDGEGIGHLEGMAVFVKDTVMGDRILVKLIKVKKQYAYGRLMRILEPSAFRVEPICPLARSCGGCTLMQMEYNRQLAWKQDKVLNCMKRIGGISQAEELMEPIIGMDVPEDAAFPAIHYRNKAQFPVQRGKDGRIKIGFYAGRTHDVMDTDRCYLQVPVTEEIVSRIRHFMEQYQVEPYHEETHSGLVRHILTRTGWHTGEVMVCLVINGTKLMGKRDRKTGNAERRGIEGENKRQPQGGGQYNVEAQFVECLKDIPGMVSISLNYNPEMTNRILGSTCRTLWGQDHITDTIGDVKYQISPQSFYQVNPQQTEKLYAKALEYADLHGNETVWDLYCGIGTISLFLAQKARKVYGVEIVEAAVEDAKKNAALNGIGNVEFFAGKAEEVFPAQYEKTGERANVIVVDPPRKGCDATLLDTIVRMAPDRIVYVSCDPATLARDVKVLAGAGFAVKRICPVEQFSHNVHVETIMKLVRK